MLYLGADVSKKEIVFFADKPGKHFAIPNSPTKIKRFLRRKCFNPNETTIGCESTGDCHTQLCLIGLQEDFPVKMINPILTKQVIRATVRNKKTDYSDAEVITKLVRDGEGNLVKEADFKQTKRTLIRTDRRLIECKTKLKIVLSTLKEKAQVMDVSEAIEAVERSIETLNKESKNLIAKATEKQERQEEILDSIPGCGKKLAAIISTEAGDIKRFKAATQFKAYVGIDPKVTQSGNYCHTGRMTKRGNSHLRYALFLVANIARIYEPELHAFYEKKRSENKSHRHALCAVSRKLCERIYAIVKKDCSYQIQNVI